MTTLTTTYCYVCEKINELTVSFINGCEKAGTRAAASRLRTMGYPEIARNLTDRNEEDK